MSAQLDFCPGEWVLLNAYDLASTGFQAERQLRYERDVVFGISEPLANLLDGENAFAWDPVIELVGAE